MCCRLAALLLCCLPVLPAPQLHADSFDRIDQALDARFTLADAEVNARFRAVEAAVERAFRGLTRRIERRWGGDTRLPSRRAWVTYSDGLDARITVDYADQSVVLESLLAEGGDIDTQVAALGIFASEVLAASGPVLDQKDLLVREMRREFAAAGLDDVARTSVANAATAPALGELLPAGDVEVLAAGLRADQVTLVREPAGSRARLKIGFSGSAQQHLVGFQLEAVRKYSRRYGVPASLVLAIIETESNFNPRAVSPVPAYGLMQLVPRTAGIDAYKRVYGVERLLTPEYLFQPAENILLGTAYFGLVRDSYLGEVSHPYSRYLCAVAAYNTGIGNIARTFGAGRRDLDGAARRINSMTPEAVLEHLLSELPAQETRDYLRKVVDRVEYYRQFDAG